ncbi:hypothetical protein HYV86_00900 [Candidatus Woesearchaeota archaeon]|nr:hypothetical protein [Candidatus Woesearchaeota archaeon]
MATRKKTRGSASKAAASKSMESASCSSMKAGCWDNHAVAYAFAIIAAAKVLLITIVGKMGFAAGLVGMLDTYLMSYSSSLLGVIAGMAEAALYGLVCGFVVSWLYNRFSA